MGPPARPKTWRRLDALVWICCLACRRRTFGTRHSAVDPRRGPSPGNLLYTTGGTAAAVLAVHSFYVIAGNTPVLVHNTGPCGPILDSLSQAGQVLDRGGFTAAGRSLTKHGAGARSGNSLFPQARGNLAQISEIAQNRLDDILTDPGSVMTNGYRGRFG